MSNSRVEIVIKRPLALTFLAIIILIISFGSCIHRTGVSAAKENSAPSRKSNIIDYVGNYNATITGGSGGVDGRDGWYYYAFPGAVQ